ncbi:hypothetical protein JCM11251_000691 [Rhodosporidiobolus azoricus]
MPRSRIVGPRPARPTRPDYFSSLAQLQDYFDGPRPSLNSRAAPPVPYSPTEDYRSTEGRGRVLVCHDYKGRYCERDDERGYTLQHWELVDTFIYFSHHRVSLPPPGWIRAAHTHGTKVLGTLIFEWDAGREDIIELVAPKRSSTSASSSSASPPPRSQEQHSFKRLSTRYADYLVALAEERGFEGYLVNVEVELGVGKEGERRWQKEHARALMEWLRYFRDQMKRKVEGAEVMWYDAVTKDGKLAWQNRLNDANLPFFQSADSLFLNYWWRSAEISFTAQLLDRVAPERRKDVYFGVDIFGRGSYGGGGFETWRAMQAIQSAPFPISASSESTCTPEQCQHPHQPSSLPPSFSTALFAPGWTVEADALKQSLRSPVAYARWLADDTYLWSHGPPTPSVEIETARTTAERKERRGVERARLLAAGLAPSASPLPIPFREPPPFDYNDLEPLPGSGSPRPISAFLPSPRPIRCSDSSLYTNFSAGSGHAFFIEGVKVLDDSNGAGWTDVGFAFPQPSLLFHRSLAEDRKKHGVEGRMTEDDAWEGSRALRIDVADRGGGNDGLTERERPVDVPIIPVELPLIHGVIEVDLTVIWKRSEGTGAPFVSPTLQLASSASGSSSSAIFDSTGSQSGHPVYTCNKWLKSTHSLSIKIPSETKKPVSSALFDFTLSITVGAAVLIGSLSIVPSCASSAFQPIISDIHYSRDAQTLRWDVDLSLPPLSAPDGSEPPPPFSTSVLPFAPPPSSFRFFHVFLQRTAPYSMPERHYLGTTFDREFAVSEERLKALSEGRPANFVVCGVRAVGSAGTEVEDQAFLALELENERNSA